MGNGGGRDLGRRAANVFGAVFQILGAVLLPVGHAASGYPTPVDPAGYGFSVWGVIYLLALIYAVYHALPGQSANPLFRQVGWFTAAAFILCGVWEVFVPLEWFLAAQVVLVAIFACSGVAHLRLARSPGEAFGALERWALAPAVGLLFGWTTAANVVSITSEATRAGLVSGGGFAAALLGVVLLILGSAIATAVVLAARTGPPQVYLSYPLAVLWALVAIVAMQHAASLLVTAVAVLCAVPVLLALLDLLPGKPFGDPAT